MTVDPRSIYREQEAQTEAALHAAGLQYQRTWWWFVGGLTIGAVLLFLSFRLPFLPHWSASCALIAITAVMTERGRLGERMRLAVRKLQFYRDGLSRLKYEQE